MGPAAPNLPSRFPCWCRATYSWGGETKRDLGFVEGDLIECLNAGDGSWWMGRLRRDKRMVGLFPSNFVQLLDDGFQPNSRGASPMPERNGSLSKNGTPNRTGTASTAILPSKSPQKAAKSSFRKPYQAYAGTNSPSRVSQPQSSSRQGHHNQSSLHRSRDSSPVASFDYEAYSRGPSPIPPSGDHSSPAPPPPPPHRYARPGHSPTPSSYNFDDGQGLRTPRAASPIPPSPGLMGHTPPFLRDAMDDVMTSLQDMGLQEGQESPRDKSSTNPWSPDSFRPVNTKTPRRRNRPRSSLGIAGEDIEDEPSQQDFQDRRRWDLDDRGPESQGDQYVERMQSRLRKMKSTPNNNELFLPESNDQEIAMDIASLRDSKAEGFDRPRSVLRKNRPEGDSINSAKSANRLRNRKSAYELGRGMLTRTFTTKSNATSSSSGAKSTSTNESSSTQLTSQSLMSASSAGCVSATSAGSLARRRDPRLSRPVSVMELGRSSFRGNGSQSAFGDRPQTPLTGVTYHSSHDSRSGTSSQEDWAGSVIENGSALGGLTAPKPKKSGFFKKMMESGKTVAASARSSIAAGQATTAPTPLKSMLPNGVTAISGGNSAREMGLGGGNTAIDWVQVRRDVNRSNSLSQNERAERQERCQMMDFPVIYPAETLYESVEGDEDGEGHPVTEPTDYQAVNLTLVDKSARFINSLPPMTNPTSLAQGYVCRPHRSDVQRLRSIFIWVSEKIAWEEDVEGEVDSKRVIQTKRGCAKEVAVLVMEMCSAVGIHAEVVQGYLKTPGEPLELDSMPHPNHWWNTVLVDGEWRIMDCSLASPTNPRRSLYSSTGSQISESWWFLPRPIEICYTHIPLSVEQQHLCPPVPFDVLMGLPCACPPYFRNQLKMIDYDTSLTKLEELEIAHIHFSVPSDIECVAEVEAKAFSRDADGDFFENGEVVKKRALAQAEWVGGVKKYTVKALLPGDEGHGVLKVYAGKRGLMHSIKDNPHPLAFAVPIIHKGKNPPYEFFTRHPTPHAQRHDLYVAQPQCSRLALNNTFVFAVRQHPSSLVTASGPGSASPVPFARPSSAMSMTSSQASGSQQSSTYAQKKPAKLAIQAPSGKILRLMRKNEHMISTGGVNGESGDGGIWETIIKCGEKGVWRGLVLADRSARWCVFAEWTCV